MLVKVAQWALYAKKALAAGAGFAGVLGASLSDGSIDASEIGALVAAGAAVVAVFKTTNKPKA